MNPRTVLKVSTLLLISIAMPASVFAEKDQKLAVGDAAPDFKLQNVSGEHVQLSSFAGKKNVVVVFSRAHWCPFCMGQLKQIAKSYAKIKEKDAEVLVVFREERDGAAGLKKSQQTSSAKFPLLLDYRSKATPRYSSEGYTTYVINKEGEITAVIAGTKAKRASPETILKALDEL